ncbi:MAG: translation initiation factor IF-2 subunit gamma, partial [Thermoproteota archaeon]|nr:translation initiation factor IF-2 subunit gamma [Thermoproteota archaeon]
PPVSYGTQPQCSNCGGKSELLRVVSFVDSPGHESLMANMLSGAALMDGAILVMAANEKVPQPQTREHLLALSVLGIQQIVLVQNKADLAEYEEALDNYKQIKDFVSGSIAEKAPIIPVSAQHKLNIDALIEAIEKAIKTPARIKNAEPVMHVLRSFDVNKPGSPIKQVKGGIIGGALVQGQLNIADEIEIRPGVFDEKKGKYDPISSEVSTLGTGAGLVESVRPGGLVAIGTKLDPTFTKSDSLIGSVVGKPGTLPKDLEDITIDVVLFDTAVGTAEMVKVEPLKAKEPIRVNIGTAAASGYVTNVKDSKVEVKLKKPVCLMPKSRVAISRRISERWRLIGSGIAA